MFESSRDRFLKSVFHCFSSFNSVFLPQLPQQKSSYSSGCPLQYIPRIRLWLDSQCISTQTFSNVIIDPSMVNAPMHSGIVTGGFPLDSRSSMVHS